MSSAFLTILPVFLTILLGLFLRWSGLVGASNWPSIDRLCYYVLFPAIFFREIARADFTGVPVFGMAGAMVLTLAASFAVLIVFYRPLAAILGTDGPQYSSVFQGVTRWHTFIAFALTTAYFGNAALALAAVSAAVMTPLLNIVCVAVMSNLTQHRRPDLATLLKLILQNPFVLSSLGGVAWHITGLPVPWPLDPVLEISGRGALGIALLSAGAGLNLTGVKSLLPLGFATVARQIAMPALMALSLHLFGITGEAASVAILCLAVPTGSGSYVLARQLGGDAPLMANILTLQMACAAITIPLVITWLT